MSQAGPERRPLQSELFTASQDWLDYAAGQLSLDGLRPEAVRRLQLALLVAGCQLPERGADGHLNAETLQAVQAYAVQRDLGAGTAQSALPVPVVVALDYEQAFAEGNLSLRMTSDINLLARDPLLGVIAARAVPTVDRVEQVLQERLTSDGDKDRMCLRLSLLGTWRLAQQFSELIAEPKLFKQYAKFADKNFGGPQQGAEFFDMTKSNDAYRDYLLRHHPNMRIRALLLAQAKRPDIITNRPGIFDWYEIKPMTVTGIREAVDKWVLLQLAYPAASFPYVPGARYLPEDISLGRWLVDGRDRVEVLLHTERPMDGLLFWTLCFTGDWVRYVKRVGMVTAVLTVIGVLLYIVWKALKNLPKPGPQPAPEPGLQLVEAALAELAELAASLGVSLAYESFRAITQ